MRFLLLVCAGRPDPVEHGPEEPGDVEPWVEEMTARGVRRNGYALRGIKEAVTVRRRRGEVLVTEGPFAETTEQICGYDVIDCADVEEAIEIASKHPITVHGSIEIRPYLPVDEGVTGATTAVELEVDVPRERMWKLVTDLSRIGEWSPECVYAAWLDGVQSPAVGARFEGRNRFPGGFETEVICVVTEAEAPSTFAWDVLDDRGGQSSTWRYDLLPGSSHGRTIVRQSFTHGPGDSGLREGVWEETTGQVDVIANRLAILHEHMTTTIRAMAAS